MTRPCKSVAMAAVVAALLLACAPVPDALSEAEQAALTNTITQRMEEYLTAVESLDPAQVAPMYLDDPAFRVWSDGRPLDRAGLLELIGGLGQALRSFEASWDTVEVTPLGRDAALAAASFRRTLIDTAGTVVNDWGSVTWVWVLRDGTWRLIHGQAVHLAGPR